MVFVFMLPNAKSLKIPVPDFYWDLTSVVMYVPVFVCFCMCVWVKKNNDRAKICNFCLAVGKVKKNWHQVKGIFMSFYCLISE